MWSNPRSHLLVFCLINKAASDSEAWLTLKGSTGQMGLWCYMMGLSGQMCHC